MNRNAAIHWKTNNAPGVVVVDGSIREWPDALGAKPTEAQIDAWGAEYNETHTREVKNAEVNVIREKKIAAGIPYQFPDGAGTIQTRDEVDIRNIQTNVTTALILNSVGETGSVMVFRDMENIEHKMTPQEVLQMGLYAAQVGQSIYTASWQLKEAAAGMTAEQIKEFDAEANWPK